MGELDEGSKVVVNCYIKWQQLNEEEQTYTTDEVDDFIKIDQANYLLRIPNGITWHWDMRIEVFQEDDILHLHLVSVTFRWVWEV